MKLIDISKRVEQLVVEASDVLGTKSASTQLGYIFVDSGRMAGLRSSALSFISMVYGKNHPHYSEFDSATNGSYETHAKKAKGILLAIKNEIEGGWVFSVKQLISAEIFSDFLEMAEYLLKQGYKDPAAVVIGSVLEENLRQLCVKNKIDIEIENGEAKTAKKADRLNADLAKNEVYTKLDQKAVTTWLDLRNNAAHGKYSEYSKEQVELMLQGVTDFLIRANN